MIKILLKGIISKFYMQLASKCDKIQYFVYKFIVYKIYVLMHLNGVSGYCQTHSIDFKFNIFY